jgi:uncharacterized protein YbjQ (UPF0145 family)
MSKYNQHRNEVSFYELEELRKKAQQVGADEIITTVRKQTYKVGGVEYTDEATALKKGISIVQKGGKTK